MKQPLLPCWRGGVADPASPHQRGGKALCPPQGTPNLLPEPDPLLATHGYVNLSLNKIKEEIQSFIPTSHISGAQWSNRACGYCTAGCRPRISPFLQEALSSGTAQSLEKLSEEAAVSLLPDRSSMYEVFSLIVSQINLMATPRGGSHLTSILCTRTLRAQECDKTALKITRMTLG